MSTYRQRWKEHYTGTPASVAYHANKGVVLQRTSGEPTIGERINIAVHAIDHDRHSPRLDQSMDDLLAVLNEAREAGKIVTVEALPYPRRMRRMAGLWYVHIVVDDVPYFIRYMLQDTAKRVAAHVAVPA